MGGQPPSGTKGLGPKILCTVLQVAGNGEE